MTNLVLAMLCKNMTFDCIQRYFMFCHILCYYPASRRATNWLQPFVFPIPVPISILQYYVVSVSLGFCAFVNKRVSGILRRIKVQNSHLVHAFDKYTRSVGNTHLVCLAVQYSLLLRQLFFFQGEKFIIHNLFPGTQTRR